MYSKFRWTTLPETKQEQSSNVSGTPNNECVVSSEFGRMALQFSFSCLWHVEWISYQSISYLLLLLIFASWNMQFSHTMLTFLDVCTALTREDARRLLLLRGQLFGRIRGICAGNCRRHLRGIASIYYDGGWGWATLRRRLCFLSKLPAPKNRKQEADREINITRFRIVLQTNGGFLAV